MPTQFDIRRVQDEAVKSVQRVFAAGVGATDLAVKTVRDYSAGAQKRLAVAQKTAQKTVAELDYDDLVKRGQALVSRIRRQPSTQEAVAGAESTVAQAKASGTPAKKTATSTSRTAKTTKTAGKKTASASSRALADGAKKKTDT